ncbi:hypothetical protein C8Q77DRAFT_1154025 [Trametes polyzona]|nr:hypothetical protein C8Q77DRAFT_1154025 [Trametes polyzona]
MNFDAAGNATAANAYDGRPDKYTAGPILIQGFLQYLCQGVIISQGAKFYHRWKDDPVALRVYVIVLLVFSLLQTMLESYKTWVETIDGRHWWTSRLHSTEFFCNAIICSLCEAFLVRRCYRITQRNVFVLIYLCTLLLVAMIATIWLTVRIAQVIGPASQGGHADPLHASMFAYPLWVYVTLAMAFSLTVILSVSLWRTRTGLRHLDRTLNHIIFITFESAALPTVCMLASAIAYSIRDAEASLFSPSSSLSSSPHHTSASSSTSSNAAATALTLTARALGARGAQTLHLDLFFAILTGKVYTLGLLRTLNARTQFRAGMHTSHLGRRSLSGWDAVAEPPGAEEGGAGAGGGSGGGGGGGCDVGEAEGWKAVREMEAGAGAGGSERGSSAEETIVCPIRAFCDTEGLRIIREELLVHCVRT